jgi:hypothetical protein
MAKADEISLRTPSAYTYVRAHTSSIVPLAIEYLKVHHVTYTHRRHPEQQYFLEKNSLYSGV